MSRRNPHAKGKKCGARTRTGGECKQPAMSNGRCRLHGGKTPTGLALPQTTHGRYRNVPAGLARNYAEVRNDPDLLSTREDVALLYARIQEQLSVLDQGESGAAWSEARRTFKEMQRALREGNTEQANQGLRDLSRLLEKGAEDAAAWGRIERSFDTIRKLSESERKRLIELEEMVKADDLRMFFLDLEQVLRANVADNQLLAKIIREVIEVYRRRRDTAA